MINKSYVRIVYYFFGPVILTVLCVETSVAQDSVAEQEVAKRSSTNRMLEEVVVTANRREEKIQDVPISITAYSHEQLDAAGIKSAQDLPRITPGFTVTLNGAYNIVFLRGVGTDAFLPGADSSVPFYLDGIALNSSTQGTTDNLGRIERVEILKGPQGTLFGRNSTGGAVNIITPPPNGEFWEGDISAEFAEYNENNFRGYITGPLFDGLAISLSGFDNERDNYLTNLTGPVIDTYARGGRAKIRWDATDSLSFTITGSKQKTSDNSGLAVELKPALVLVGAVYPSDEPLDRKFSSNRLNGTVYESELYSLVVDWTLGNYGFQFLASDQKGNGTAETDFDHSPLPILDAVPSNQPSFQRSAEFQISSTPESFLGDRLEWVAGMFYYEGGGGFQPLQFRVAPDLFGQLSLPLGLPDLLNSILDPLVGVIGLPPLSQGITAENSGVIEGESYSAFAQGTYMLLDEELFLTLGVRYQEETRALVESKLSVATREGEESIVIRDDIASGSVPELNSEQLSPKVALRWNPGGGENQIFASWARGFKSPTYNTVNVLVPPDKVDAEQTDSYEIGFKSRWLDGDLRLNGAAFYIKQTDLLSGFVSITSGGIVQYSNVPEAEIKGAELDFVWRPLPSLVPGLVVAGSGAYLDAIYTDFPEGPGFDKTTGLAFGPGSTTPLPARDFSGLRIVRTPELSYNFGINQNIPFDFGSLEIGIDMAYSDEFFFLPQNSYEYARADNTVYNARVNLFLDEWGLQITAFGRNITDEEYVESNFSIEWGPARTLNAPRVYGMAVNWSFGS